MKSWLRVAENYSGLCNYIGNLYREGLNTNANEGKQVTAEHDKAKNRYRHLTRTGSLKGQTAELRWANGNVWISK